MTTTRWSMSPKVRGDAIGRHYPEALTVEKAYGKRLGIQPSTAHHKLFADNGVRFQFSHAIEAFRESDAYQRLHAWWTPVKAVMAFPDVPANLLAVEIVWALVDALGHARMAMNPYLRSPDPDTWRRLRQRLVESRYLMLATIRAEDARWEE